jgi:hypothetical protein
LGLEALAQIDAVGERPLADGKFRLDPLDYCRTEKIIPIFEWVAWNMSLLWKGL